MPAFSRFRAGFLCIIVVLFYNVHSVSIGDRAAAEHDRASAPNAAIRVPAADGTLRGAVNDETSADPNSFFDKIGKHISNMFSNSSSQNKAAFRGNDAEPSTAEGTERSFVSGNDTSLSNETVHATLTNDKHTRVEISPMPVEIRLTPAEKNKLLRRSKGVVNGTSTHDKSLKTTTEDIVTTRMRLISFIEGISASLEDMHKALRRFPWSGNKKELYNIVSRNDSMLIAAVSGKRFYSGDGSKKVKPVRAVFHKHKLTVEIEELSFSENRDKSSKVSEEVSGIGTEYQFSIPKMHVDVEEIYLRATNGQVPGYEIIIPLRPETNSNSEVQAVSRRLNESTGASGEIGAGHWGTNREEDEYSFLQAQMECQKMHGISGIRKLVCTCEKVHVDSVTRRLLCLSRVADKVVKVAQTNNEGRVAGRVYRGSIRCRNARYGIQGSYDCLLKLLERHAGEESELHKKHGRNILSWVDKGAKKVDGMVGRVQVKAEEFVEFNEEGKEGSVKRAGLSVLHVLTFTAYVIGIALLVFCLVDVGMQYRRHRQGSQMDGKVSRLSAQAQALYSRLVMRNE